MAIHFTSSLLVFFVALRFFCSVVLLSASPSLVFKLIHPNQIYSLEHPHVSRMEKASLSRLDYLQARATGDIVAHVSPDMPPAYLVNISIGSPSVMQLLHMDTGSDLLWVQCRPCTKCYLQSLPIFDPSKSYTHGKESCETSHEYSNPRFIFDAEARTCRYSMHYLDGTTSKGTLAKETLTFDTIYDESSSASLSNVVFGCGHENYGKPQHGTGVLGLGYGKLSLVHRFGSKFSYCLGSLHDPSYPHNVLVIGDSGSNLLGDRTSLEVVNGLYYVRLEGISVGGSLLPVEPWVFQRKDQTSSSGTIIDTGSSLTMLATEAYEPLKEMIEEIFDGRFENFQRPIIGKHFRECYKGNFEQDLVESGFPAVAFHFSDGAELSLDAKAVFSKVDHQPAFCLNVVKTFTGRLNIIGAAAQQNFNVGYDLEAHKISFESIDCGVLFDDSLKVNINHHH